MGKSKDETVQQAYLVFAVVPELGTTSVSAYAPGDYEQALARAEAINGVVVAAPVLADYS